MLLVVSWDLLKPVNFRLALTLDSFQKLTPMTKFSAKVMNQLSTTVFTQMKKIAEVKMEQEFIALMIQPRQQLQQHQQHQQHLACTLVSFNLLVVSKMYFFMLIFSYYVCLRYTNIYIILILSTYKYLLKSLAYLVFILSTLCMTVTKM